MVTLNLIMNAQAIVVFGMAMVAILAASIVVSE